MKKFKKMLVALCLCVCVALSVGLVGCADSKTLAEIDDLKAKIEQKDTTIAEKDAKIKDLTLTDLEKVGAMTGAFKIAEDKYATDVSSSTANAIFKQNEIVYDWTTGFNSSMANTRLIGSFMPSIFGRFDKTKLFGGSLETIEEITDSETLKANGATDKLVNNYKMVVDYSKSKYAYSLDGTGTADGVTKFVSSINWQVMLENGKVASYIFECKNQMLGDDGKVSVVYEKIAVSFDYNEAGRVYVKPIYTYEEVRYIADAFDGNIDETAEILAIGFSGYKSTINKVDMLYGYTVEENPNSSAENEKWDATTALANTKTSKEAALEKANQVKAIKVVDLTNVEVLQSVTV